MEVECRFKPLVLHLRISGRVKLWRIAMSSSLRTLTVSGTRFSKLTIESVTTCRQLRRRLPLHSHWESDVLASREWNGDKTV